MKILHIIETLKAGGKERQLLELVRGFNSGDFTSFIIVISNSVEYDIADISDRVFILPRRTRWDLGLFGRIHALVRKLQPDIIHSWGEMCSIYCIGASNLGNIPFVSGHIRDAPSKLSILDRRYFYGKIAEPFATAVVANSMAGLRSYAPSARKAHVIYNGFDLSRVVDGVGDNVNRELGITTKHLVTMVARFGPQKDHETYFAAAQKILAQRADVTFLAVGDRANVDFWQRKFESEPRIKVPGRRNDVKSIAAASTIGVLLTNILGHGEGISNALVEFMASGKPVIATDDGGTRELVTPEQNGFLVRPGDVAQLCERINLLLNSPELRARLGTSGRNTVAERFSRSKMIKSYAELYRQLGLKHRGAATPSLHP